MSEQTPAASWPHVGPDEFGPYLAEQLKDPEVRAAYDAEAAEQTPIPDGDRYVAGVLTELRIEPYMSGGKWRFEITEEQMMALATRIFIDGRGAGRTAAAEDPLVEEVLRAARVWRLMRADSAAVKPKPESAALIDAVDALRAARVAENGADRLPAERTTEVALTCGGCNDTIWPTETFYEFADGRVRCVICQVQSRRAAGADQ